MSSSAPYGAKARRWAAAFFGLAFLAGLATLPYAIRCCSRFSAEQIAFRESLGPPRWAPEITSAAIALLDWPMGFRLLVMGLVAAFLSVLAIAMLALFSRSTNSSRGARWMVGAAKMAILSAIVGIIYILMIYVSGYVGYRGPLALLWMLGVPALVGLIEWPPRQALMFAFPLALLGWFTGALISLSLGIPWD